MFEMNAIPFQEIKNSLSEIIPSNLIDNLPNKWEKIGDVLIIVIPKELENYKLIISEKYAEILDCKSVLQDIGGISGELRVPKVKFIYGDKNTTTVHMENGIRYKFDPQKVMFSSGNMDERIRMSSISNVSETVVDLFAGIGYFTLPIAFYSKPKLIYACEKNRIAYDYLCENVVLNNVVEKVHTLFGDNRIVAPKNIADRVIMGYIGDTSKFLKTALLCLKNCKGILHFHDKYPEKNVSDSPLKEIQEIADEYDRSAKLINSKKVKSYAPGIGHFVFDIRIDHK
jgi:tRNA wybutosine-synthesizing protein 2